MLRPEAASTAADAPSGPVSSHTFRKSAVKVIASSIRKGNVVELDGKLYVVLTAENIHPGKGTPVTQIDMRRISDGVKISERYRPPSRSSAPTSRTANYQFLYQDGDGFHFMNTENYDQVQRAQDDRRQRRALPAGGHEGEAVSMHEGLPVAIELPQRVTLEVVETEPVMKGQTASSSYKPAMLSNGVAHLVPPHIGAGTRDRGHDRGRLLRRARQGLTT